MSENRRRGGPGGPPGGGPMGGVMRAGEKAKDFKGAMGRLIAYLRRYWVPMAAVFVCAIAGTVFSIWTPKIMGGMTNDMVAGLMSGRGIDFDALCRSALFLAGLYLFSSAFSYVQGFVMAGISQRISYALRRDIAAKIHRMPLGYFDSMPHGQVLSRVTNDVDTVSQTLNQSLSQLVTSVVTIVGVVIMMFSISWQLTLVAIATVPLSLGFMGLIIGKSQRYFKEQQGSLGELNGHIEETYGGHNVVKVFGAGARMVEQFSGINRKLYTSAWKSQFYSGLMMPLMGFIGNLGYVGVCFFGCQLALNGTIMIGDIQSFIQYLRQFTQPVSQLATVATTLQSTAAAAERVFGFLEEAEETPESASPAELSQVRGDVAFNHVVFGYHSEKTVITGLDAQVEAGRKVAIVGPTGAGKTTLVNLLMRFYDVGEGSIAVDGVDVRNMRRADLRRLFGMVLQDAWLFNGTIRENVLYAKPDATEEELWQALRAAQADHFIHALPEGLDTEINEEAGNLSQGQKQLLTIARAMLAAPPMLILDEATSSVDTRTEVLIKRAMDNLMQGRTSFIIAHRLSTIRDADLILVMRDGNVVEQGAHQELLQRGGFYAELYNSQFAQGA